MRQLTLSLQVGVLLLGMSEFALADSVRLPECPKSPIGELYTYEYGPKVKYEFRPISKRFGEVKISSDMSSQSISIKCTMQQPPSPPYPIPKCGVNSFSVLGRCKKEGLFEGANYECYDGSKGTVPAKGCLSSGELKDHRLPIERKAEA